MQKILRKFFHDGMTVMDASTAMQSRGAKYLGEGMSTKAYRIELSEVVLMPVDFLTPAFLNESVRVESRAYCIRVSTDDEAGIRLTFEAALKYQDDPYAPRIYDMMELNGGFAAAMEVLRPLGANEPYEVAYKDLQSSGWKGIQFLEPGPKVLEVSPYMREIDRLAHMGRARYDLHPRNIMRRDNGEYVILDPLYSPRSNKAAKAVQDAIFAAKPRVAGMGIPDFARLDFKHLEERIMRFEIDDLGPVLRRPFLSVTPAVPGNTPLARKRRAIEKRNEQLKQFGGHKARLV